MSAHTLRWVTFLLVALACVLPTGSAQAGGTENVATAITEQDGGRAFDFAWDIDRQRSDESVEHLNSANARARCVECRATAIAFQIVLVHGSPSIVTPRNVAEAINLECTRCTVIAEARQFVRVTPEPVRLTNGGRAELADVRRDLAALEAADPPPDQLHLAVEAQEARVREVLRDDLMLSSDPDTEAPLLKQRTLQAADLR
jgi:hypothetical protein